MYSIKSSISTSILHVAFGNNNIWANISKSSPTYLHTNHPQPVDIKTITESVLEDPEMIHRLGG